MRSHQNCQTCNAIIGLMNHNYYYGQEVWKSHPELPYEVSSYGHIRHVKTKRVRAPYVHLGHSSKVEYLRVTLNIYGKRKGFLVHRLVAETFIGPPPGPKWHVHHRNGDGKLCAVWNVEWREPWANHPANPEHVKEELPF